MTTLRRLALAVLLLAAARSLPAQEPDAALLPWLGCWTPADAADGGAACVVPLGRRSIEILALAADGSTRGTDTLVLTDGAVPFAPQGCTGTEWVGLAADAHRIYRRVELACDSTPRQQYSRILAISPQGEWLDVQAIEVGGWPAARVRRYHARTAPAEIAARLPAESRIQVARLAAATAPSPEDVVEASSRALAPAVEHWLAATGVGFALDARLIQSLASRGVSGTVMDVLVALAYPGVFKLAPGGVALANADLPRTIASSVAPSVSLRTVEDRYLDCLAYDRSIGPFSNCRYILGYDPLGLYPAWYLGDRGVVVVAPSGTHGFGAAAPAHGRVVNGQGYKPGPGSVSTSTGHARGEGSGSAMSPSSMPAAGASSSASGSATSTSTTSNSGQRTAQPRP